VGDYTSLKFTRFDPAALAGLNEPKALALAQIGGAAVDATQRGLMPSAAARTFVPQPPKDRLPRPSRGAFRLTR
jgi:hypothetical protein